jgi:AcrR family transcriptional regulator
MSATVRSYRSPLRAEQARRTRTRILEAARQSFRERGYAATTLADVAREAAVAEPTVRAVFKTKPNLLAEVIRLVIGGDHTRPRDRGLLEELLESSNADELVTRLAEYAETLHRRSWDVLEIAAGAAGADPAIGELLEGWRRKRHADQRAIVRRLRQLGALPTSTNAERVSDLLWLYTSPEVFRMLVIERSWPPQQYRAWLRYAAAGILA